MYQALPLLSLGMRLKKDSSKIIKFIDVFFVQKGVCFGFVYHLLVSLSERVLVSEGKRQAVQNVFQPIPGLISCTGATGRWGLLFV